MYSVEIVNGKLFLKCSLRNELSRSSGKFYAVGVFLIKKINKCLLPYTFMTRLWRFLILQSLYPYKVVYVSNFEDVRVLNTEEVQLRGNTGNGSINTHTNVLSESTSCRVCKWKWSLGNIVWLDKWFGVFVRREWVSFIPQDSGRQFVVSKLADE